MQRVSQLLFLDVDGVLNSVRHGTETGYYGRPPTGRKRLTVKSLNWDPACVARVQRIVVSADAAVVISSSWRLEMSVKQFRRAFELYGWNEAPVIGATPQLEMSVLRALPIRGCEVAVWLAENMATHPRPRYVCLDDMDDFLPDQPLVRTDWNVGVQDDDVERALALLSEPGSARVARRVLTHPSG